MPSLPDIFGEYPTDASRALQRAWDALPTDAQRELIGLLPLLPGNRLASFRSLLRLTVKQFQMAFGDKRSVAIIGPANVGKSTLYNQLIRERRDEAVVGPVPGTTRVNQAADAGLFTVVDTPGADAVGARGAEERAQALDAAQAADFLILMFDAVQGIKQTEQELFADVGALDKPYIVVLNKMDLVRRTQKRVIDAAAANLGLAPEKVLPIEARSGRRLESVLTAIVKAEPELLAAIGRALPAYRWQLAWRNITGAATTAGLIGLTPIPFLDFVPLVGIQASLVLGIARIYNYRLTPARAKELVGTFALGFLGRTLFYELSKFGGPPGWLLAAAIAAATTVVMGYAAIVWFDRGERLTTQSLKRLTAAMTDYLIDRLKRLGTRKPSKRSLSEELQDALESSPLAEDRSALDDQLEDDIDSEVIPYADRMDDHR